MNYKVWDKRNRMTESRTATNVLLGTYLYNERGLRVKAERYGQPAVQVVRPNGGESLYLGALDTINWSGMGLSGSVKLDLLVNNAVVGTIADNLPASQTSYQWQVGKTLSGTVNPGSDYKVRVTAVVPPAASGTTYYFYDSGGKLLSEYNDTGTCVKDYLYLGGKMIGEYLPSSGAYYYYASDQINSTRLVTDSTGAVVHSAQYDPYGGLYKTWIDTYHPKPGFSGKERELYSDLDCFGARYYGHKQYRFLSVDPVINKNEAITNPQLWNLYSYCADNPISIYDPNGGYFKYAADSTNEFRLQVKQMREYLSTNPKARAIINELHARPEVIILKQVSEGFGFGEILSGQRAILVNPLLGLKITEGAWSGWIQSPAMGFLHECAHALKQIKDRKGYYNDVGFKDSDFGNLEEWRVINFIETPIANELGEPTRERKNAADVKVSSPIWHGEDEKKR